MDVQWHPIEDYNDPQNLYGPCPLVLVGWWRFMPGSGYPAGILSASVAYQIHGRWHDYWSDKTLRVPPTHYCCNVRDIPLAEGADPKLEEKWREEMAS